MTKSIAVLLLALWLPVTSHCQMETILGLNFLGCCQQEQGAPHQDSGCDEDLCASIEAGFYQVENPPRLVAAPPVWLMAGGFAGWSDAPLSPEPPGTGAIDVPPELSVTWQFSFRVALLPRAPTVIFG